MSPKSKLKTARPLDANLQAKINESVKQRLANKLEREGSDVAEWLRETVELHLKGELHRGEAGGKEELLSEVVSNELASCLNDVAELKAALAQTHQRIRADLAQFFIALLCNPSLLPDGMALSESDLGQLLACMFPDTEK